MFCKKCGQQVADGTQFCPACGAQMYDGAQMNGQNFNNGQGYNAQGYNGQGYNNGQGFNNGFNGTVNNVYVNAGTGMYKPAFRGIGMCILLSIVTCGIYGIIWLIQMADDLRNASGDVTAPSGGMVFLLSLVTCGIYLFVWMYKAGDALNRAKSARGMMVDGNSGVVYLLLSIFGLSIVSYCLIQSELNKLAV